MSQNPVPVMPTTDANIRQAAELLKDGHLVAFATETVYGLGADGTNEDAVAAIYAAKGRPSNNPLILHVGSEDMARKLVVFNDTARQIADAFWPGPLTLVLPKKDDIEIAPSVSAGLNSLAIRFPAHEGAQNLLRTIGRPLAAPSANPSGKISPTDASHVAGLHGAYLAMVLDGGPCPVGLESTIVGFDDAEIPVILRPGFITADAISDVTEGPVLEPAFSQGEHEEMTAPGQMTSHYAPNKPVRLGISAPDPQDIHISFGENREFDLSPSGSLEEAARNLFAMLRRADEQDGTVITIAPIPHQGLGIAINDRLQRAAAPR